MAASHSFRTAARGFHREDVVRYIEYLNNQHKTEVAQLRSQLGGAAELQARLEAAEARCAELEAKLAQMPEVSAPACVDPELETYRRAERTEREARERAQVICAQAQALLEEATRKAEAAREQFDAVCCQLEQYQRSANETRQSLQETVTALNALHSQE